jgi:methylenetetrahydrofolate reductase (NADPH)
MRRARRFFHLKYCHHSKGIENIFAGIDPLMEFKPPFIDVTYHREETVLRQLPTGAFEKRVVRKRPGTVAISAAIMHRYNVDAVPHIICGGFTKEETENALIDLHFLGIDNVLLLRGDAAKHETSFTAHPQGNKDCLELIEQVENMNQGLYLDDDLVEATKTNFCVGVGGYPEKHFEAPNLTFDLDFLKKKIDAGADYIVTQMFYDNKKFFDFVNLCQANGINVPIIPGLKPLATKQQLSILPKIFHIDIPETLVNAALQCKDNKAVKQVGVEWAIQQCKELKAAGVPVLHFYTMSKSEATYAIAKAVF